MRTLTALLLLLTASGCVGPAAPHDADATTAPAPNESKELPHATGPAPVSASYEGHGRVWLPPSQGSDRVRTHVSLDLPDPGMRLEARLRLASTYFGLDAPTTTADVQVQLLDPTGQSAANGTLNGDEPDLRLEVPQAASGTWLILLLSYGGSDGESSGDHVDYEARAASASEAHA